MIPFALLVVVAWEELFDYLHVIPIPAPSDGRSAMQHSLYHGIPSTQNGQKSATSVCLGIYADDFLFQLFYCISFIFGVCFIFIVF